MRCRAKAALRPEAHRRAGAHKGDRAGVRAGLFCPAKIFGIVRPILKLVKNII